MGGNQRIASANRRLRVQNGSMKFGRFAGATRILGRMPAGVALVALGIRPPQSSVISGRGIAAAATARPNAGQGRRRPWLPRSRGRPTGPGSTTRASQIRRDDLGGRRIRGKTWGGRARRAGPHSTARSGTVCCEGGFARSTRTVDPSAVPDAGGSPCGHATITEFDGSGTPGG